MLHVTCWRCSISIGRRGISILTTSTTTLTKTCKILSRSLLRDDSCIGGWFTRLGRLDDLQPIEPVTDVRFPNIAQPPGILPCANGTQGSTASGTSSGAEEPEPLEPVSNITSDSMVDKHAASAPLIHTLPPELVVYIFSLANECCIYGRKPYPHSAQTDTRVFASVCTHWRNLALGARSLWSHIDLLMDDKFGSGAQARTQFLLERAGDEPLNVHICESKPPLKLDSSTARGFLIQHAHRIRSLDITLYTNSYDLFLASLVCVRNSASAGVLKSWRIQNMNDSQVLCVDTQARSARSPAPSNYIHDEPLRPLQVLHLNNVFIGWNSLAYHGLVDLQIEWLPPLMGPTLGQLAAVFSASPRLRIFKLADAPIKVVNKPNPLPVYLEYLEELNLLHSSRVDPCGILDIISTGPRGLSISIRLDDIPETIRAVTSFFDRSNIVRLFVGCYSVKGQLPALLCQLPKLRELALQSYDISQQEFFNPMLWPRLRAWYLLDCRLDWDALYGMVCTHNLATLRLWECYLDPVWPSNKDRNLDSLVEVLGGLVPDTKHSSRYSGQSGRSTLGWSFAE